MEMKTLNKHFHRFTLIELLVVIAIIGILSSLFTAIFITRLILERAASKSDNVTFTTPLTANWLRNTKFPFLKKRKIS